MDSPVSVLSVDDEGALGDLLARALLGHDGLRYVGHSTADTMLSIVAGTLPDVVVLDVHSSRAPPREAMIDVRRHFPQVRFIVLFDPGSPEQVCDAELCAQVGAAAALSRDSGAADPDSEWLLHALRNEVSR